ncbi:MAG: hypothetical protein ABJN36_11420 [Cyclobacteriaceae bacterium]
MGKNEESPYDELESLVSILMEEMDALKKQNEMLTTAVTKLVAVSDKPKKLDYVLKASGLDKQIEDSKLFVSQITESVRHARSIIESAYTPKWFFGFAVFTACGFCLSSLTLYCVIDDVFYASKFRDFVYSDERIFDFFFEWRKRQ